MKASHLILFVGTVAVAALACGGETPVTATCVTGQSIACAGNGGCSGSQVCKSDGTYDTCSCGQPTDGGITDGSIDTGTSNDAGPDATSTDGGPWTPKSFGGLALWLDTSVGVVADLQQTGYVKRWLDQSGNGNNAEKVDNNGTGLAVDPQAINGHDVIVCGYQTHFEVADSASVQFGTGGFLVAAVLKYGGNTASTIYPVIQKNQTLQLWMPIQNEQALKFGAGSKTLSASFTTPKWTTVIAQSTMSLEFDGVTSTGPAATEDVSAPGWPVFLCGTQGTTTPKVEFAEIIMVKGTAKPADVVALKAYFKTKYGL